MSNHGGPRPGAGRPRLDAEPMERHDVTLRRSDWDKLKEIGDGNASFAIRVILYPGQCPVCGAWIEMLKLA